MNIRGGWLDPPAGPTYAAPVTIEELWDEIRLRFDPRSPVPWKEIRHEPRPGAADKWDWGGWIAQRTYDPLAKIQDKLSLRRGPPRRILYLGTVGTGKTTELRRLAPRLSEQDSVHVRHGVLPLVGSPPP